jgi:hypothetical protein
MVLVLVAWASTADSGADATDAVATALQAWLVAHHAHLAVPGGELALDPLGLTLLPLVLLHTATVRAGRAAGVRGGRGSSPWRRRSRPRTPWSRPSWRCWLGPTRSRPCP